MSEGINIDAQVFAQMSGQGGISLWIDVPLGKDALGGNVSEWREAYIEEGESIEIHHVNPIFDSSAGGAYSHSFTLNCEMNRHIIGNSDELRGSSIYKALYGRHFRLYVCGVPMLTGVVRLDSEVEIEDGSVEIELASDNKEWGDLLEGVKASDVVMYTAPLSDDEYKALTVKQKEAYEIARSKNMQIGLCIPSKIDVDVQLRQYLGNNLKPRRLDDWYQWLDVTKSIKDIQIPKFMLVKYEGEGGNYDFTNVQEPYPIKPYCNTRICYQKYIPTTDNGWEKKRGYNIGEPDRINSSPNFYVLWWVDKLMESLGVNIRSNALTKYMDICRLAFFNAKPGYEEEPLAGTATKPRLEFDDSYIKSDVIPRNGIAMRIYVSSINNKRYFPEDGKPAPNVWYEPAWVKKFWWDRVDNGTYFRTGFELSAAYANGENFPDDDASTVIEAIENMFCCRFMYDANTKSLDVVMVDDILKQESVMELPVSVSEWHKRENHTLGFRLKYSAQGERKKNSITKEEELTGKTDSGEDTTFNYNDYTRAIRDDNYGARINDIGPLDKRCFVNTITGNQFRIKVDKDAKYASELYPSLFEVAQFCKAEWGDCSNEEFVETVDIGFNPIVPNDVNVDAEKEANKVNLSDNEMTDEEDENEEAIDASGSRDQIFAQFLDVEMHQAEDDGKSHLASVVYDIPVDKVRTYDSRHNARHGKKKGHIIDSHISANLTVEVRTTATWDLSDNDSPLHKEAPGMNVGIMRGSGSDAHLETYDYDYDGEGNSRWMWVAGTHAAFTADSVDQYGQFYDYNGSEGITDRNSAAVTFEVMFHDRNASMLMGVTLALSYGVNAFVNCGWPANTFATIREMRDKSGKLSYVIWSVVDDKGVVFYSNFLDKYVNDVQAEVYNSGRNFKDVDRTMRKTYSVGGTSNNRVLCNLYVARYDSLEEATSALDMLNRLVRLYSAKEITSDMFILSSNGLGYDIRDAGLISLKLRAEKKNPYYNPNLPSSATVKTPLGDAWPNTPYFPVDEMCARRGLADKMYDTYAYWVINRKTAVIEVSDVSIATLVNIDMTVKYRIGDIVGFIKEYSYRVGDNGLLDVKFELYYL